MSDVVVIGAGMGGMACAALIATRGHSVHVIEAASTYGGKVARVEHDGFRFDVGPSLLTLPAVYREIFGRTGQPLDELIDITAPTPAFSYHFSDGTRFDLPDADPAACARAMGDVLGGTAREDWLTLIARGGLVWDVVRGPVLEKPLRGLMDMLPLARRRGGLRAVAPHLTLRSLGEQLLRDPRQRMLLDRYATYTGSDPRRAPAALVTVPYVEQVFGAHHVGGGIRELATAMYERCRDRGVTFGFDEVARRVVVEGGVATGVETSAGRHCADVVVCDADADVLYRELLPSEVGARARRRLARSTPSLSGFVILLALRGRTPGLRHHNVWFPADYDAEFDALFARPARPVPDPTIYVCAPDDPAMRPSDDVESWFVLVNAPRHAAHAEGTRDDSTVDWTASGVADAYADHVLKVLADRGTDIRHRIIWKHVRTPADLARETGAPGGAIYGTSSNGARAAFLRPANIGPVGGLFLVGGSAHPGGGLPLVGMSALIVADLVGSV